MKIVIDKAKCTGSGECFRICPTQAIIIFEGKAHVDANKCNLDGICIPACPNGAIDFTNDDEGAK